MIAEPTATLPQEIAEAVIEQPQAPGAPVQELVANARGEVVAIRVDGVEYTLEEWQRVRRLMQRGQLDRAKQVITRAVNRKKDTDRNGKAHHKHRPRKSRKGNGVDGLHD